MVFRDSEELLKDHNELMKLRDNYVAHAGDGNYQFGGMVAYLNPDQENPLIRRILFSELRVMNLDFKLPAYNKLSQFLLDFVRNKLEELKPHFDKEMGISDLKELYKRAKLPNPKEFRIQDQTENLNVQGSNNNE